MSNTNCLAGMRCPACGSYGPFFITLRAEALVYDDGVEEYTDCEWDDENDCVCHACSHTATVLDFWEEVQDDGK